MIIIIGAGPVGCFLGGLLAKNGKEVKIYEEHDSIGKPLHCTGIITEELGKIVVGKREVRLVAERMQRATISGTLKLFNKFKMMR